MADGDKFVNRNHPDTVAVERNYGWDLKVVESTHWPDRVDMVIENYSTEDWVALKK